MAIAQAEPAVVAALVGLGAGWGWFARRVALGPRYRRPGDPAPRHLIWAVPAGAMGASGAWALSAGLPWPVRCTAVVTAAVLLLLALVDAEVHRLPDALVRPLAAGLAVCDLAASVAAWSVAPLAHGLAGGLGLYLVFYLLALVGSGLGYGDVKLAGAVGLGLGPLGAAPVVAFPVVSFVLAGLGAIVLLATGRAGRRTHLALGPALATGAVLALAWA